MVEDGAPDVHFLEVEVLYRGLWKPNGSNRDETEMQKRELRALVHSGR